MNNENLQNPIGAPQSNPVANASPVSAIGQGTPQNNPVVNTPPVQTSAPQGLDPDAVNLAKAIRQTESGGNYASTGASGEQGGYQFTNNTWDQAAPKYGVNVPLDKATPQQQNEVAYNMIENWKQQGHTPPQIASMWNAGEGNPDAYEGTFANGLPSSGPANSYGVAYNTPAYVEKVAQNYQSIKNGTLTGAPTTSQTSKPNSTLDDILFGIGGLGLGIGGALLAPETGGASLEAEPEAAALGAEALGESGAADSSGGLLNTIKNSAPVKAIEGFLGIKGAADAAGNLLGIGGSNPTSTDTSGGSSSTTPASIPQETGNNFNSQTAQTENTQEQNQQEEEQVIQNSQKLSQAVADSANQTQAGSKLMQTQAGIEGAHTIGINGFTPDIDENGRQNWANAIIDADTKSSELDDHENELLDAEGGTGKISEVASRAKEIVRSTLPQTDWDEAYRHIDNDVASYTKHMGGDEVGLGSKGIGRIRREGYKAFDRNASNAKNGARKALGSAANKHILEKTKHKELIGGLHKEKEKLINAKKVMTHLNGKKSLPTKSWIPNVLRKYGEYIGITIGDKIGGGLGAVIGSMVSSGLIKAVDKKWGKSEFESPALKKGLELLKGKNPKVYDKVTSMLKKYKVEVEHEKAFQEKKKAYEEKKKGMLPKEKPNFYEPYKPLIDLPSIQMGHLPKKKKSTLPVIK